METKRNFGTLCLKFDHVWFYFDRHTGSRMFFVLFKKVGMIVALLTGVTIFNHKGVPV